LNAFTLIRTLTVDTLLIEKKLGLTLNRYKTAINTYTPKKSDFVGAIKGLNHLQESFSLKTSDLAAGIVEGKRYSEGLIAHDLFEIGQQLINMKKFNHSIEYLKLAVEKTKTEHELEIQRTEILIKISEAYERSGDIKTAVNTIDKAIHEEPGNTMLTELKKKLLHKIGSGQIKHEREIPADLETKLTRALCSGRMKKSSKELSKLHCRLVSRKGYSLIAPFKLEEAHLDPYIVVFHDVIYDKEIESLKKQAKHLLEEGKAESNGEHLVIDHIRKSKVAWFFDDENPLSKKISKRTKEMTGLTMETAEGLQMQQYGIAGFYKCHFDVKSPLPEVPEQDGERVATVLYYVS
jgi:prolyl 4-hydroxylase